MDMRTLKKWALGLTAIVSCAACSGAATTSGSSGAATSTEIENAGAAVSALFSGFGGAATQNLVTRFTINSTGADICDADNLNNGPSGVFMSGSGNASDYPYGSATDPMTISDATYFCENRDGTANSNTGPDGDGMFATFILVGEPEGECDGDSAFTFTKGSGIARNTAEYYPEIFGRFEIDGETMINCTLRIDESGVIDSANSSCTDDNGDTVALNTETSCTINADLATIPDPAYLKGHYAIGEGADQNLNDACANYDGFESDDDHVLRVVNDCDAFLATGVNTEFLSIMTIVTDTSEDDSLSSWSIGLQGTTEDKLRYQIQLLRSAGLQVMLELDALYVTDPENVDDTEDFPVALIDNPDFQADLRTYIVEWASFAERMGVELYTPLSESDRVFNLSADDDDVFLAEIIDDIKAVYSGKLAYVTTTDLSEYTPENLARFDLIGVNISPFGHQSYDEFIAEFTSRLENMRDAAANLNDNYGASVQHYINSLGVWGAATEVEILSGDDADWTDDQTVATAFAEAFDVADTYGSAGFVAWEGAPGEFVYPERPLTLEAIVAGFAAH